MKHKNEADLDVITNDYPDCKNTTEKLHKLERILLKVSSSITGLKVNIYKVQPKINTVKRPQNKFEGT